MRAVRVAKLSSGGSSRSTSWALHARERLVEAAPHLVDARADHEHPRRLAAIPGPLVARMGPVGRLRGGVLRRGAQRHLSRPGEQVGLVDARLAELGRPRVVAVRLGGSAQRLRPFARPRQQLARPPPDGVRAVGIRRDGVGVDVVGGEHLDDVVVGGEGALEVVGGGQMPLAAVAQREHPVRELDQAPRRLEVPGEQLAHLIRVARLRDGS
jgi:hypothetical protein